jgi:uncharacterized repeat protein (TIGR03803 family)
MKRSRLLSTFFAALLVAGITFSPAQSVMAQTTALKVLHSFTGGSDGGTPVAGVIFDSAGNIYGTTFKGGDMSACSGFGCGIVYKLTPTGTGTWTESSVHRFQGEAMGLYPTDLLFDSAGNLYGIDALGGVSGSCVNLQDCQIAFELSPTSTNWKETVLQTFSYGAVGGSPNGMVADAAGNLYGSTAYGGSCCGLVFRLSPNGSGGWQETVLYDFSGTPDGATPLSTLILDAAGNLYGTTATGGSDNTYCQKLNGCGVVFELSPTASGPWTETVLHTFNGTDGYYPRSGLTFDSAGNLYGTTEQGGNLTDCGSFGCGVVFKLSPSGSTWTETVLHAFTGHADGYYPFNAVTLDAAGNVYGGIGGGKPSTNCSGGCGVIFKLAPSSTGHWTDTLLHSFTGGSDGIVTGGVPLIFGPDGNLYGTTEQGGTANQGIVFSIAP